MLVVFAASIPRGSPSEPAVRRLDATSPHDRAGCWWAANDPSGRPRAAREEDDDDDWDDDDDDQDLDDFDEDDDILDDDDEDDDDADDEEWDANA